jgi:hypothetical protein
MKHGKWEYWAGAVLLGACLLRLPAESQRDLLAFCLRCGSAVLFAAWLYKDFNRWIGLFMGLAVFSHSIPGFVLSGLKQLQTDQSFIALQMVAAGCLYYAVLVAKCKRPERLMDAICILGLLQVAGIVYAHGINPAKIMRTNVVGFTTNPNESSAMLALCTPAFFRRYWIYPVALIILGLVVSKSFGGVLGFCLAVVLYLFLSGRGTWWHLPAMMACIAAFLCYIHIPGWAARWQKWEKGLRLAFANQPLIGFGLGNWKTIYPSLVREHMLPNGWLRLNSTIVQAIVEMGFLFPIIVAGFINNVRKRFVPNAILPVTALAPIIVACSVNCMFRLNPLNGWIAITWLAVLEIKLRETPDGLLHTG